jgi:hypothetical protein
LNRRRHPDFDFYKTLFSSSLMVWPSSACLWQRLVA